jgi:hypothetical protein
MMGHASKGRVMRPPSTVRPASAALGWAAAMCALWAATSAGMFPFDPIGVLDGLSFAALLLFMAVIGLLIARSDPAQPVGWLFSLCPALVTTSIGMGSYAEWTNNAHAPGGGLGLWLALWAWAVGLIGFMLLLPVLFPDGRPLGGRWRWLLRADLAVLTVMVAALSIQPLAVHDRGKQISNPAGIAWADSAWVVAPLVGSVIILILAGLASAIIRYRRASGVERLQMREVLWAAVATVVGFVLISVLAGREFLYNLDYALIPLAVGAAMLRYRLYQVDVIIRRTLTYASLVAVLAAIYLTGIALIGTSLRTVAGQSGALAVTLSTLLAAAAFAPLRRRIQRTVDRRFNRAAYDARATVEGFSSHLRAQVDLEAVTQELLEVVAGTVQPAQASLWLRPVTIPERQGRIP